MPVTNLNNLISELPRLSGHAADGEDISADLAGLLERLTRSVGDQQSTVQMIRGRLRAQVETLGHSDDPRSAAECAFYRRAIERLDAALGAPRLV